ncbi:PHD finger protein MALE MEIOCYTE DEATH 1 [Juglans microcarpa x Juglans regia]|uniref:PHD finger protein MALE MEIOCYTE DEATH 1 n=1 Tax=Juglans microcarpa x Juglans regia TaxID=2249226 RepID=UPI001B7E9D32|nr:PHD finger protein MALE MEIOCYTE DEATH 1 [Juglans microcarpa x Juglans regia]
MSISILEACKKRKRRPKLYGFQNFGDPGCPIDPKGAFRDNIRLFLQECADLHENDIHAMPTWCTLLVHETRKFVVPLYTFEEDVKCSPRPPYCDHCRCAGWSNHFVSKRKYHLIIPADEDWNKPLDDDLIDLQNHLLHGLIHCNGFGHLICINGIEGGSKYLCGREIMDLWDRICTNLGTRKITVEDVSKKRSMDLRLLYGVAYGHSWFGRWGYRFCRGSFGVAEHNYDRAIEVLSSLELDKTIQDFSNLEKRREIKQLILHYRYMSETQLVTIKDLLRFMLTIKSRAPLQINKPAAAPPTSNSKPLIRNKPLVKEKSLKYRSFTALANMDSRWPARRLEYAAEVIVNALKVKKEGKFCHGGMTRQDLRDAARLHIGDTGLLDYVLKSMNNVVVGNHIVCRTVNPTTRILEYSINELGNEATISEPEIELLPKPLPASTLVPGFDVYSDLVAVYKNLLLDYKKLNLVELATQVVLDSKHFVKEWPFTDEADQYLRFICRLLPSFYDIETELNGKFPPGEIVVVPLHATVGELKQAVESALRDTYCITEGFLVIEIKELEELEDEEVLFGAVESGVELCVRGRGIDLENRLRYQSGADTWMVRCECGARDDDGERMVACDICEVWQHTRCCGIEDTEAVPPLFVCSGCCVSLGTLKTEASCAFECSDTLLMSTDTFGLELGY